MISVLLGGDIIIDRPSSTGVLDGIRSLSAGSDVFFANLEAALTTATEGFRWKTGPDERYWDEERGYRTPMEMKMRPEVAGDLTDLTAVTVANNHMMDYGIEGLFETLESLDAAGIGHAGGGRNWDEATSPFIVDHAGTTVALLAYTSVFNDGWGASPTEPGIAVIKVHTAYEPSRRMPAARTRVYNWVDDGVLGYIKGDVAAARRQADVVVVGFHWGQSKSGGENPATQLGEFQTQLAHAAIDAGATIIHGVHPHFVAPMEIYRGCPIFYSFGHLVFDTLPEVRNSPDFSYIHGPPSIAARCFAEGGRIFKVEVIPLAPDGDNNPVPVEGSRGEEIARLVTGFPGARDLDDAVWDGKALTLELAPG